jgi:hypothetical protein
VITFSKFHVDIILEKEDIRRNSLPVLTHLRESCKECIEIEKFAEKEFITKAKTDILEIFKELSITAMSDTEIEDHSKKSRKDYYKRAV